MITFSFAFLLANYTLAQVVVKGGYDDWCLVVPIPFDDPDCWNTSNPQCTSLGLPWNVALTEDANDGTYALLLETGSDSFFMAFPAIATFRNRVTYRPDKLTGLYKADLKLDDYSGIRILVLSARGIIGRGSLDFSQSTNIYTSFEVPITYISATAIPDSFSLSIYSSLDRATKGTILMIDELALVTMTDVTEPLAEKFTTRVTPNPATDEILVEVPVEIGLVTFRIFDNSGRILAYKTFENQVRINVYDFTAGLYLYEVRYKNGEMYDHGQFRVAEHKL